MHKVALRFAREMRRGEAAESAPALAAELQAAISLSLERRDLHLLALDEEGAALGYVFLWAASSRASCTARPRVSA